LVAAILTVDTPAFVGVPLMIAVPLAVAVKMRPPGSFLVSVSVAVGLAEVTIVKLKGSPTEVETEVLLVNTGRAPIEIVRF
jgi:hypothetical protein